MPQQGEQEKTGNCSLCEKTRKEQLEQRMKELKEQHGKRRGLNQNQKTDCHWQAQEQNPYSQSIIQEHSW